MNALLIFVVSGALWSVPPGAFSLPQTVSKVDALVEAINRRYSRVHSVTSAFRQTYRAPGVEQVESGILFMKKPGLMRWEYKDPEVKIFVADGRTTYLYTPEDRQVLVRPLSSRELQSTPLQFLLGQGNLTQSFSASEETALKPELDATFLIRLVPRTHQADYASVVMECDRRTLDLRRIVIQESTGNTSEFLLTDLVTNVNLDDKKFRFQIPRGVEVIHVDDRD